MTDVHDVKDEAEHVVVVANEVVEGSSRTHDNLAPAVLLGAELVVDYLLYHRHFRPQTVPVSE